MVTTRQPVPAIRRKERPESSDPLPPPQGVDPGARELPAELLKRLEFKVLRRLDGYLFGDYSGLFYGPSLDLAEVREYQPGDEVRKIDWNVTARTGKLHVRQYREEREIIAWLVVDLSPSMAFGTRRVLKSRLALEFTALAAAIITRQGNKVGAIGFSPAGLGLTPLGAGRRHVLRILQGLMSSEAARSSPGGQRPGRKTDLVSALEHANSILRRRALVVVVSDFIDSDSMSRPGEDPAWGHELRRLAGRHDLVAVQICDPAERGLPEVGDLRLRDPETGQEVWVDTGDPRFRRSYARLVENRAQAVSRVMQAARADVLELSTDTDIVGPVLTFTLRRRGRRT